MPPHRQTQPRTGSRRVSHDYGQCNAYTRQLTRCTLFGHFDNYHFAILCDRHADMEDPPFTFAQAQRQRQERDNRLHNAWRERRQAGLEAAI